MSSNNIILKNCIVKGCNKPIDETFYDRSKYRPICSKECYGKYIDSLPKRYEKKTIRNDFTDRREVIGEYHMKGRLHLVNYNLNY